MRDFSQFEERISLKFNNKDLLRQALTHRSYINENPSFGLGHNERLEFLGDAVLELAVTERLFDMFPDKPEGELTSFRAALVNANMLSDIAVELEMNEVLLLSRGEAKDMGRARQYILANAFEALVGAIYLDLGYEAAKKFIERAVLSHLDEVLATLSDREARVLKLRFGLEGNKQMTLEEVGKVFGVTRERIRQIEAKALRKLKHPSRRKKLQDYLD